MSTSDPHLFEPKANVSPEARALLRQIADAKGKAARFAIDAPPERELVEARLALVVGGRVHLTLAGFEHLQGGPRR